MNPTRTPIVSLAHAVEQRVRRGLAAALPAAADADPLVRPSEHADLQANGVLPLAKRHGVAPRELAARVAAALPADDVLASVEPAGPGFLNITLADAALLRQAIARADDPRLGVPESTRGITVIDYSQPNIAKEMHIGHLRSTVVGDALARMVGHAGATVIRQNHLGDWGTNFGMLVQFLAEHPAPEGASSISRLNALYREARTRFEADPGFAERSRAAVVALQAGAPAARAAWSAIVAESTVYFEEIYRLLDVLLEPADAVGESFYNAELAGIADDLQQRGIAVVSDGALCVFPDDEHDDVRGPSGDPVPLIVRKSDGGFGYAVTDLAAIRHRVQNLHADRILYVVDARQALHSRMVFAAARRAGYLPDHVEAVHVSFGTILGPDGKPFRSRAGETVRLRDLLDPAVARARATVAAKDPDLPPDELDRRAREIGIGAVKFADLATSRTRDYVFDLDRMLSLTGDTGVYLQYAHARVRSILRRLPPLAEPGPDGVLEPAERRLALVLDGYGRHSRRRRRRRSPTGSRRTCWCWPERSATSTRPARYCAPAATCRRGGRCCAASPATRSPSGWTCWGSRRRNGCRPSARPARDLGSSTCPSSPAVPPSCPTT